MGSATISPDAQTQKAHCLKHNLWQLAAKQPPKHGCQLISDGQLTWQSVIKKTVVPPSQLGQPLHGSVGHRWAGKCYTLHF